MPASSFNLYNMQYARNNFDAMRPAPICPDANHIMGHCQNIHISTNCYHGFHQPKHQGEVAMNNDYEMQEVPVKQKTSNSRKRCADETDYPQLKRHREEGMVPTTSNLNTRLPRPTHNNPDISRCLMAHMI